MAHSKSPAGAGAPGGDGNVVAGNSASLSNYSPRRRQRQRRPAAFRLTLTPHSPGWWNFAIGDILGGCRQEHLNSQDYFLRFLRLGGIDVPQMSRGEYIEMLCNAILIGCGHGK